MRHHLAYFPKSSKSLDREIVLKAMVTLGFPVVYWSQFFTVMAQLTLIFMGFYRFIIIYYKTLVIGVPIPFKPVKCQN